jgi:hypothetical protein
MLDPTVEEDIEFWTQSMTFSNEDLALFCKECGYCKDQHQRRQSEHSANTTFFQKEFYLNIKHENQKSVTVNWSGLTIRSKIKEGSPKYKLPDEFRHLIQRIITQKKEIKKKLSPPSSFSYSSSASSSASSSSSSSSFSSSSSSSSSSSFPSSSSSSPSSSSSSFSYSSSTYPFPSSSSSSFFSSTSSKPTVACSFCACTNIPLSEQKSGWAKLQTKSSSTETIRITFCAWCLEHWSPFFLSRQKNIETQIYVPRLKNVVLIQLK